MVVNWNHEYLPFVVLFTPSKDPLSLDVMTSVVLPLAKFALIHFYFYAIASYGFAVVHYSTYASFAKKLCSLSHCFLRQFQFVHNFCVAEVMGPKVNEL